MERPFLLQCNGKLAPARYLISELNVLCKHTLVCQENHSFVRIYKLSLS